MPDIGRTYVEPWRIEAVALVIRCGMEHDGSEQDQAVDEDALRAIEATGYPAEVTRLRQALADIRELAESAEAASDKDRYGAED